MITIVRAALFTIIIALLLASSTLAQTAPAGSTAGSTQPTRAPDTAAINALLDGLHQDAAHAREEPYFARYSMGAVFLGTDATERWTVEQFRAFAHPYFEKGALNGRGAWVYLPRDRRIDFAASTPGVAWFDELLDNASYGVCRGTGVVVREGDKPEWRIAQYSLSIPVPNDLAADFVKRIFGFGAAGGSIGSARPPSALDELHVLTFNIRYNNPEDGPNAWPNRREMVSRIIDGPDPWFDIVGLQEVLRPQLDDILAACPRMAHVGVGRDDGVNAGEFSPVLYRRDRYRVDESGTFWFSETPESPGSKSWGNNITRICTWARLLEPTRARAVYVFNVHLDHESQPSREQSAALLVERVRARAHPEDPVLITGDFNAGESNAAVRTMLTSDLGLSDTFRALHPDEHTVGTFNDFKGVADGDKIDYVFAGPGFTATAADIRRDTRDDGRYPSDHFPVTATIRWPAAK